MNNDGYSEGSRSKVTLNTTIGSCGFTKRIRKCEINIRLRTDEGEEEEVVKNQILSSFQREYKNEDEDKIK